MNAKMKELSRVRRHESGWWLVEILSAATGKWIVQGEHLNKVDAEQDRKHWL